MEKKYEEYIALTKQIKVLEERKKELSPELLEDMNKNEKEQVRLDDGVFSLVERKSYKYSEKAAEEISTKKGEIKVLQQTDINSGQATEEISKGLRFQLSKTN